MKTKIFISYAWTSDAHRQWVRLLAIQLRLLGYAVLIDSALAYGASLSNFMREATEADRVLMIVDENYVERADHCPKSGVAVENQWIEGVFGEKPVSWLSVLFVGNPRYSLPIWIKDRRPKGFDFNSNPEQNEFPGIEQMDDLWRWVEGLPADKEHALSAAMLLDRMGRLERIDVMRDPANYANPALKDRVTFRHQDYQYFTVGHRDYAFKIMFSARGNGTVAVYIDCGLKAIGLVTAPDIDLSNVETFLGPWRVVDAGAQQSVVMMNLIGALCIMKIEHVQDEVSAPANHRPEVTFSYEILTDR